MDMLYENYLSVEQHVKNGATDTAFEDPIDLFCHISSPFCDLGLDAAKSRLMMFGTMRPTSPLTMNGSALCGFGF